MSKHFLFFSVLILSISQASCSAPETNETLTGAEQNVSKNELNPYMVEALTDALHSAPLTVLLRYKNLEVLALADNNPNDTYAEERHNYCGEVLEVFRGKALKTLCYYAITEKGETPVLPTEPQIVSLCMDKSEFYWPGVGSSFPSNQATLGIARDISQELRSIPFKKNTDYSLCN